MATRGAIAVAYEDRIEGIYCHWDSYLSHNGKILVEHYGRDAARRLVELGDLSSLDEGIGVKHDFDNRPKGECNFYGRDRGETGCGPKTWTTAEEYVKDMSHSGCEYFYILGTDNQWWVTCAYGPLNGTWTRVKDAFEIVRENG